MARVLQTIASKKKTIATKKKTTATKKKVIGWRQDYNYRIPKPAIARLAHQAGVKYINGLIYEELRGVMQLFIESIIKDAVVYTKHAGRTTVTEADILESLKKNGHTTYSLTIDPKNSVLLKRCPAQHRGGIVREIKRLQGATCVMVAKTGFSRLVRYIAQDFMLGLRFTPQALAIMQIATEAYTVGLLSHANDMAIHAGRQTIQPKNVQRARQIRGDGH